MERVTSTSLPISQAWLVDGFCWYATKMVRKRFQGFGLACGERTQSISADQSVVVFANHSSWWDPIAAMLIRKTWFPDRVLYAPMDADQLENYSVLKKMGFYGVRLQSFTGAQKFLEASKAILADPKSSIWITPEGRFCDVRDHRQELMPGLAHLAVKCNNTAFIPLALEYVFWDDQLPYMLAAFGHPITSNQVDGTDKASWNRRLTESLRETQSELSELAMRRDFKPFQKIIERQGRIQGAYDFARMCSAWIRGKRFEPRHSRTMNR